MTHYCSFSAPDLVSWRGTDWVSAFARQLFFFFFPIEFLCRCSFHLSDCQIKAGAGLVRMVSHLVVIHRYGHKRAEVLHNIALESPFFAI